MFWAFIFLHFLSSNFVLDFFIKNVLTLDSYQGLGRHASDTERVDKLVDNLQELVYSFYSVGFWDGAQSPGL